MLRLVSAMRVASMRRVWPTFSHARIRSGSCGSKAFERALSKRIVGLERQDQLSWLVSSSRCLSTSHGSSGEDKHNKDDHRSGKHGGDGSEKGPFTTRLYEALNLQTFTREEFEEVFHKIDTNKNGQLEFSEVSHFLGPELTEELFAKLWQGAFIQNGEMIIPKENFIEGLESIARKVDYRVWRIAFSMLLNGTAVGIVVPVLPLFVKETLSGTSTHFGLVIGAFALSKMLGNVPSAVLADSLGRKPVLGLGMGLIAAGTSMIAFADSFSMLLLARFITGAGVAGFTTASTLYLADVSTPLNRATSMAPIMAAFSAGTAMGPAIGGFLADAIGPYACFGLTGACFTGLTLYNHFALSETLPKKN